ncbi:MAG: ArsC family reductase [Lautropia sp.]|nr:ArsC family reductase [Lautropia sp.]
MNTPEVIVYGIPNCDQIKKTRQWLNAHQVAHHFHDYRRDALPRERLEAWVADQGLDRLLNRRGTTWRALDEAQKQAADTDPAKAITLMLSQPSLIKRPVIEISGPSPSLLIGFSTDALEQAFS